MSSAWSQLDQLLTCAICLDRYRNPKLLPCQHTFCMEPCLEGLIDYGRRQIKCPECRAEHRIPYQGVQAFPTNVTLVRFLELHRDITGEEPEPPPSMMERCNVCSEKANLERCAHCEKKICADCKEAHIDILRREINRINNQVRRGLHRLSDALSQTKKNAEKLQLNCTQVKDEIDDIVKRYSKDLKHTEERLKHDLEIYTQTELKSINKLKEDLDAEVSNITSNCELIDKYVKDNTEWADVELLEYKEIFLKTLDFLRTFDTDNSDFTRRIKFQPRADPDVLHRNIADFGELKVNAPVAPVPQQSLAPPPSNALMRSQSDHRLAAQFARRQDNRSFGDINQRLGGHTSDTEREGRPTSPLFSRSRRDTDSSYRRYGDRSRDYDYQEREYGRSRYNREENSTSGLTSSRWRENEDYGHRSRYGRDYDDYESESQHTRTVRFADDTLQSQNHKERIFDVGDATKGPLSGVVRLMDISKVMERLHQNEARQKQKEKQAEEQAPAQPPPSSVPAVPQPPPRRPPSRQQSEDDIDRQKRANKQQAASSATATPAGTAPAQQTPEVPSRQTTRRQTTAPKEEDPKPVTAPERVLRVDSHPTETDENTASPRVDTVSERSPEPPSRFRKQPSVSERVTENGEQERPLPSTVTSNSTNETSRSISRQVSQEETKIQSKDSSPPSERLVGTREVTTDREICRSPSGTVRDDTTPYTTRRHVYSRHQSDTRFDRPVTSYGIGRQSPISEDNVLKGDSTVHRPPSVGRSITPTGRICLEDYTGLERPNYNRFRNSTLSRTSSTSSMCGRTPESPEERSRSPSTVVTNRYSPLYRRTFDLPFSGLEPTSNDESYNSDSSSSSSSSSPSFYSCSCYSDGEYFNSVSVNHSESDSDSFRCPRPTLGKAASLGGVGATKPPLDKKASLPVTRKAEDNDSEDDEEEEEVALQVPRATQSSFFSRFRSNQQAPQRRLPDPEPRLLQTQDDESEEDDDEDDEDDDEEEEEDEDNDQKQDAKTTPKKTEGTEESESETSSSSSSSSSSDSESSSSSEEEDDEEEETAKTAEENSKLPNMRRRRSSEDSVNSRCPSTSTATSNCDSRGKKSENETAKRKDNAKAIYEDNEENEENKENDDEVISDAVEGTAVNNAVSERKRPVFSEVPSPQSYVSSSQRSDDTDTTDSSSTSSTKYHSLSRNTTPIVSNGTAGQNDDSGSSEGSSSGSSGSSSTSTGSSNRFSSGSSRRPPLARSRSSHEIGLGIDIGDDLDDEVDDKPVAPSYRSRADRMSEGNNSYARTRSRNQDENPVAALSSSSNNSWAKYLRNKYGSSATGRVVPRSRSSHSLYQRSDSESSEDEGTSGRDSVISPGSYGFSNPRSTYLQKKRMLYKIGSRGTEPGNFTWPRGIAVGPDNNIVVADSSNHRVQVFDAIGKFLHEFGTYGSAEGEFDCLAGVAVNRIGQYIVSDRYNQRIQLFDPSGRFLRAFGCEGRTDGRFNYPWGITTDSLGFIYVCDKENHRIQVFQSDGTFVGKFGSIGSRPGQLEHPHYIAVSNTNRVIVSDNNNHRIQIFDVNGRSLSTFGSEGSAEGQFKFPRGVAVDDQGYIVVGDSGNNRVQIFHPDGTFLRAFGTWGGGDGEFKGIEGVAVTSGGSILVCDRENHRIQVF